MGIADALQAMGESTMPKYNIDKSLKPGDFITAAGGPAIGKDLPLPRTANAADAVAQLNDSTRQMQQRSQQLAELKQHIDDYNWKKRWAKIDRNLDWG